MRPITGADFIEGLRAAFGTGPKSSKIKSHVS